MALAATGAFFMLSILADSSILPQATSEELFLTENLCANGMIYRQIESLIPVPKFHQFLSRGVREPDNESIGPLPLLALLIQIKQPFSSNRNPLVDSNDGNKKLLEVESFFYIWKAKAKTYIG